MSRRLLLALCTATLTAASLAATSLPADARHRYRACVLTNPGAWFHPYRCHGYDCWTRIAGRRAFRIVSEEGPFLLVRNWVGKGWVIHGQVRLASQSDCRAAGI